MNLISKPAEPFSSIKNFFFPFPSINLTLCWHLWIDQLLIFPFPVNVNPAAELPAMWSARVNKPSPGLHSLSLHCCGLVRRVSDSTALSHTVPGVIKWIQLPDQDRGEGKTFSRSRNIYCRNWKHLPAELSYKPGFTVWEGYRVFW